MTTSSDIPTAVSEFAVRAKAFCGFVDSSGELGLSERLRALAVHLAELYAAGLRLPVLDVEDDGPSVGLPQPQWAGAADLSIYWEQFDPYEADAAAVAGSIDDDVHDVYTDLQRGLVLYDSAWRLAAWEWQFHLGVHWGNHAVDALRALQRVI